VTYTETPPTATLKPRDILRSGFTYSAVVSALDASGNAAGPTVATFKTPEPTVTAKDYSFWDHSTSPACSEASDDKSVEVGVQFTADVPGLITGIRFFRLPGAYGPYVGRVWSRDGKLLANGPVVAEAADGWQTVNFSRPVPISPGAIYVASYHCDHGHYAYTANFFDHRTVDAGPIHAPAGDVVGGGNGVFSIANHRAYNEYNHQTNFPNQTYHGMNYWVDVDFVPTQVGLSVP